MAGSAALAGRSGVRILLDTAPFLWAALAPGRLSARAARLYEDPDNDVFLSVVSVYEIVLACKRGTLDLGPAPGDFVRAERTARGIATLAFDEDATVALERLPTIHADPFDRSLIAQSIANELTLLTPDLTIAKYPIRVLW